MSNQNWKVVLTADKAKFESDMKKAKQIVKHYSDESRRYLKNIDDAMTNLNSSSKWTNRLLLFTQAGNLGQLAQGVLRYADSYTELGNRMRLTKYIGEADQAIGVTEGLAKGVEFLSSHLDELSRVLGVASVGLAGFYGTHKFKQHRNHINTIPDAIYSSQS